MRDPTARYVYPVLDLGLDLRDRLAVGRSPAFDPEHARLMERLMAPAPDTGPSGPAGFLGVRYALACWLDELLTREDGSIPVDWATRWKDNTLEVRLYAGANQRAWRFWEQARRAEGPKGSPEALEAFLWAVMLGFRGTPPENLDPAVWVDNVRRRVLKARSAPFPLPGDRDVPFAAHPLYARARRATFLRVAAVLAAVGVFALTVAGTSYLNR